MSLADTNITLALPYNHDPGYPEWLDSHAELCAEVFLPAHPCAGPTTRPWGGPADREAYHAEMRRLAVVLSRHALKANVVLNMPCWSKARHEAIPEVGRLAAIFGGDTQVTLSDFPLARDVRRTFPSLGICVSTAARVDNIESCAYWKNGVGADTIVLSREINKRPQAIRAIRSLGVTIKMVVDDLCLPHCPAQLSHAALAMHGDDVIPFTADCFMKRDRSERPWLVAQKDVVPASLPRYDGLIDIAKLDGRSDTLASIDRRRLLYLEATSWEHPKGIYSEPPEALDKLFGCDLDCDSCRWCEQNFEWR